MTITDHFPQNNVYVSIQQLLSICPKPGAYVYPEGQWFMQQNSPGVSGNHLRGRGKVAELNLVLRYFPLPFITDRKTSHKGSLVQAVCSQRQQSSKPPENGMCDGSE